MDVILKSLMVCQMNKRTLDILFYISIIVLCISLTSCASKNKKMETHPTNNKNALEALDKFWELLRPVRILTTGVNK